MNEIIIIDVFKYSKEKITIFFLKKKKNRIQMILIN